MPNRATALIANSSFHHIFVDHLAAGPEIAGDFPVRLARQVHLDDSRLIRQIGNLQSPPAYSIRRRGWLIFKPKNGPLFS